MFDKQINPAQVRRELSDQRTKVIQSKFSNAFNVKDQSVKLQKKIEDESLKV